MDRSINMVTAIFSHYESWGGICAFGPFTASVTIETYAIEDSQITYYSSNEEGLPMYPGDEGKLLYIERHTKRTRN